MEEDVENESVRKWVEKIGATDLPILNQTNKFITSAETYINSHAWDIAKAIMHDPNMTSKILRLANSVFFNTSHTKINTVSKAVVYLGYDAIRSICFSTAIFEKLVAGNTSKHALSTIANSVHAAVQAKMLADKRKERNTEEVFIGALLYNIGELSFWCMGCPEADSVLEKMSAGKTFKQAQKEVLGFEFGELTNALTKDWQICEPLTELLNDDYGFESKAQSISLGYDIVAMSEKGWNTKEANSLMKSLEEYSGVKKEDLGALIKENTKEAESVIREFGVTQALEYLPGTKEHKEKTEREEKAKEKSNPKVQVDVLSEMTALHGSKVDINLVVQLALDGMQKGVGLDRVVLGIKNPKLQVLKGKFVKEAEGTGVRDKFNFQYVVKPGNLYDYVFNKLKAIWINKDDLGIKNTSEVRVLKEKLGVDDFFIAPMLAHGKCIGVFYADRYHGGYKLDEKDFEGFTLFTRQASVCLREV